MLVAVPILWYPALCAVKHVPAPCGHNASPQRPLHPCTRLPCPRLPSAVAQPPCAQHAPRADPQLTHSRPTHPEVLREAPQRRVPGEALRAVVPRHRADGAVALTVLVGQGDLGQGWLYWCGWVEGPRGGRAATCTTCARVRAGRRRASRCRGGGAGSPQRRRPFRCWLPPVLSASPRPYAASTLCQH